MLMMAGREVSPRVRERAGAEGKDLRMAAAVVAMVVAAMAVGGGGRSRDRRRR